MRPPLRSEELRTPTFFKRFKDPADGGTRMDEHAIRSAYRRWAPVYDHTFGRVAAEGRKHAVEIINQGRGACWRSASARGCRCRPTAGSSRSSASTFPRRCWRRRASAWPAEGLDNVTDLHEMDASDLKFPDASFDTVVAMYVMTVVPDPEKVMRELSRVCRPGGEVLLVNHFSADEGMRGWVERRMAPFADKLGWRPRVRHRARAGVRGLAVVEKRGLRPWALFTMMRFRKANEARAAA